MRASPMPTVAISWGRTPKVRPNDPSQPTGRTDRQQSGLAEAVPHNVWCDSHTLGPWLGTRNPSMVATKSLYL